MTAQDPEKLVSDSDVDLTWLRPYDVSESSYPVQPELPVNPRFCSANWNGYIANLRLHEDYRLELEHFEFPFADDAGPQICNAFFRGDFSITFRPFFAGPRTTIPFRDGRIVQNREQWEIDDQRLHCYVVGIMQSPGTRQPEGLRVEVCCLFSVVECFAPVHLVPPQVRGDLDALVGKMVTSSIKMLDEERGTLILEIESVLED